MSIEKKNTVRYVTKCLIMKLESEAAADRPDTALLAALRNSTGKSLNNSENVWPFLFENIPDNYLSTTGKPTYEENAIFTVLQLYAICKQGSSRNVICDEEYKYSIGASLRNGRNEEPQGLDRRFNAMIASSSFDELSYHLRQMVRIVKAKSSMIINFSKLADDLYWYQLGKKDQILFKWATDYYRRIYSENEVIEK